MDYETVAGVWRGIALVLGTPTCADRRCDCEPEHRSCSAAAPEDHQGGSPDERNRQEQGSTEGQQRDGQPGTVWPRQRFVDDEPDPISSQCPTSGSDHAKPREQAAGHPPCQDSRVSRLQPHGRTLADPDHARTLCSEHPVLPRVVCGRRAGMGGRVGDASFRRGDGRVASRRRAFRRAQVRSPGQNLHTLTGRLSRVTAAAEVWLAGGG